MTKEITSDNRDDHDRDDSDRKSDGDGIGSDKYDRDDSLVSPIMVMVI